MSRERKGETILEIENVSSRRQNDQQILHLFETKFSTLIFLNTHLKKKLMHGYNNNSWQKRSLIIFQKVKSPRIVELISITTNCFQPIRKFHIQIRQEDIDYYIRKGDADKRLIRTMHR